MTCETPSKTPRGFATAIHETIAVNTSVFNVPEDIISDIEVLSDEQTESTADLFVDYAEAVKAAVDINDAVDIAQETLSTVIDDYVASKPKSGRTHPLIFDDFCITNGTAENPIFLIEGTHLRDNIASHLHRFESRLARAYGNFEEEVNYYYAISKEKLEILLSQINRIVISRVGTSYRHVDKVTLSTKPRIPPEIIVEVPKIPDYQIDNTEYNAGFSVIAAALLQPIIKRKIIFQNNSTFSERGGFQIHIRPPRGDFTTPKTIFGWDNDGGGVWNGRWNGRYIRLVPARQEGGLVIYDDINNGVAELYENALEINVDIRRSNFCSFRIFYKILEQVAIYKGDPGLFERLKHEAAQRFLDTQKNTVTEFAKYAFHSTDLRRIGTREVLVKRADEARLTFLDCCNKIYIIDETAPTCTTSRLENEIVRLYGGKVDLIKKIWFDDRKDLHVLTDEIVAYDKNNGNHYLLGRVEIIITLPGNTRSLHEAGVRIMSVRQVRDDAAEHELPHCNSHGYVCWGNVATQIGQLVASFEIEALITFVIGFLQNPNPYDREGRKVRAFPVVPPPQGSAPRRIDRRRE